MPEIVTKYPDVVMQLLNSLNAKCGKGEPQRILINCPKNQFCALPTGELCVYGIKDVSNTTQITPLDMVQMSGVMLSLLSLILVAFLFGILAGIKVNK